MRSPIGPSAVVGLMLTVCGCTVALGSLPVLPTDNYARSDLYMERHGYHKTGETYGPIHRVYATGQGAPVILLHELPGLREADVELGAELGKYFEVHVPLMFGVAGQDDLARGEQEACNEKLPDDAKLFRCRTANVSQPIVKWLEQLVAATCKSELKPELKPCGIIGMCLTGTVPLSLINSNVGVKAEIKALVLAQPTLPATWRIWSSDLDIADTQIDAALDEATRQDTAILLTRYDHDLYTRHAAFDRLSRKLASRHNSEFVAKPIPGHGHSTLIRDTGRNAVTSEATFHDLLETLKRKLPHDDVRPTPRQVR
jgi:dienelactone hydrolase